LIIDSYRSAYDELCIAQLFSGFVFFFVRKSTFLYFDWAVPGRAQKHKREVTNEGKK
jgi:phosphotransferase system  glucose/maltose/N-acetylglucosamine-specific IIC component